MAIQIDDILAQIKPVVAGWIKTAITQYNQTRYSGTAAVSSLFTAGASGLSRRLQAVSDIADSLGIVTYGELRVGTGDPDSGGASPFSGVRIAYPPLDYNSASWNIAGLDNDVLQFGLSASNGTAYAGGGNVILSASGIGIATVDVFSLNASTANQVTWTIGGSPVVGYVSGRDNQGVHQMLISTENTCNPGLILITGGNTGGSPQVEITGNTFINASAVYPPYIIRQTADDSASTITLQNSGSLLFPLPANQTWVARFVCPMTMAAAAGHRSSITVPASPTNFYAVGTWVAGNSAGTDYGLINTSGSVITNIAGAGTTGRLEIDVSIANGSASGNVVLRFAQSASNATATKVKAGAYVQAQRIS